MKLELRHIAPYLPYGLECIYSGYGKESEERANITAVINDKSGWEVRVQTESGIIDEDVLFYCKPILHPLSFLTKEIEHNGERFVPIEMIAEDLFNRESALLEDIEHAKEWIMKIIENPEELPFFIIQKLLEYSFDVFGLLDQNLAINLETLK